MKMNPYYILDTSAGAVIALMVVANTELGVRLSIGVSMLVNQVVGIVILTLCMMVFRGRKELVYPKRDSSPWYLWANGLFGIPIIVLNSVTVLRLGASLAMASTVFGQSLMGFIWDRVGFMRLEKRSFSRGRLLSLSVSLLGIIVMALGQESYPLASIALAMLAGALTITQMVMNSTFASAKGPLFAARQNVIGGLVGGLPFFLLTSFRATVEGVKAIPSTSPLLVILGGTLAVYVVTATNIAVVKVPAVYSSLLIASSQILVSLVIDKLLYDRFSPLLLWGSLLMIAGMVLNLVQRRTR